MTAATHRRPHTSAPTDGSRTITLRDAQPRQEDNASESNATVGVLKLRGAQRRTRQRVAWGADVVDNEGCGKKKSKICCIYHKPRRFDESSSESDSASDSGSEQGGGDRARPTRHCRHAHAVRRQGQDGSVHALDQSDSESNVNAYERQPKRKS